MQTAAASSGTSPNARRPGTVVVVAAAARARVTVAVPAEVRAGAQLRIHPPGAALELPSGHHVPL